MHLFSTFNRFLANESGATAIEYGLIGALVAVGSIAAMTAFGGGLSNLFSAVATKAGGAMDNSGN